MPKKRRQAHIPQQVNRKRRTVRRPEFSAAPQPQREPEERVDLDGNPIFADDVLASQATAHYGFTGPVETRPHWIGKTAQEQRQPGRRVSQLRHGGAPEQTSRVTPGQLPTFAPGYLSDELRRIAITSGSLFLVVIVLALVMR
jgi:hypothetical protein